MLPYAPRPGQEELAARVAAVATDGGHLLVEAPTGIGKTVAALAGAQARDGKLVYATRTNSQQAQVLKEHRHFEGLVVPFMGRRQYCPFLRDDERYKDGSPEELGRLCSDAKTKARQEVSTGRRVEGACPYYARLLVDGEGPIEAILRAGVDDASALAAQVENAGSCAYEGLKALLPKSDTVVLPHVFLIDESLRRALFEWLGTGPDACTLVVDEAHHLPQAARDHHSPRLSLLMLQRAIKEAEEVQDPTLIGRVLSTSLLDALVRVLHRLVEEFVAGGEDADGLLPADALQEALLEELRLPSPALARIAVELEHWGDIVREAKREQRRLPRSYLGSVGSFLNAWTAHRDDPVVHLVTAGENPAVEAYLLDPAGVLSWHASFWATVHMSGTLTPLAEHRRLCGLPERTTELVLGDPFPKEHLRVYGLRGVHRRTRMLLQDPGAVVRQQEAARALLGTMTGRTGVFFPSHRMLQDYVEEGFLHDLPGRFFQEEPGMAQGALQRLVDRFRSHQGSAVLLGVLGGRLTEGIDYPGDAMDAMLIMGIPYPKPSARSQALIHHFDRTDGTGWQTAVHTPTGRVLRQTLGRLIRGPDDRGVCVVLDERVTRFPQLGAQMIDDVAAVGTPRPSDGFTRADALSP